MADNLGMKVSKLLLQEEPLLLSADLKATVVATSALAKVTGCLLATILTKCGEQAYLSAVREIMKMMHSNACGTANKAIEFTKVRDGLDNIH